MILILDTETTGKPINYNAPMKEVDNWPRVIQLAWMVCNESGEEIVRHVHLIKPDGWVIPKEEFWIKHGYSTERSEQEGVAIEYVLDQFVHDLNGCHTVVAHNLSFDYNVLGAELLRKKMRANAKPLKICTMVSSTDLLKIPGKYGYKYPNLTELHNHLFGRSFEGAHDAMNDVVACKDCFFELRTKGLV
jgi:DNA polymerase III epsilon subunit-like protein